MLDLILSKYSDIVIPDLSLQIRLPTASTLKVNFLSVSSLINVTSEIGAKEISDRESSTRFPAVSYCAFTMIPIFLRASTICLSVILLSFCLSSSLEPIR